LARELADVLHYLIPDRQGRTASAAAPAIPTLAIAADPDDALRAAFAWNLCVEITRLGTRASLLSGAGAPFDGATPGPGRGPVGAELVLADAQDPAAFAATARNLATSRARQGGLLLVRVSHRWLEENPDDGLFSWTLLFSTPAEEEVRRASETAARLQQAGPGRVGLTVHGVADLADAEALFLRVAGRVETSSGHPLLSYGTLLDDLQLYRTFVEGRPVGLRHPQSRAASAVADVARLLLGDAVDGR